MKSGTQNESEGDSMSSNEYLFKICAIGSPNMPKTSLIRRYAENKFDKNYLPTLGVDITTKKIRIDNYNVKLILVDTAGQEFFGKLRPSYYRGASACMIFFLIEDKLSISAIPNWIAEFRKYISSKDIPIMLLGIKNYPQKTQKFPKLSNRKTILGKKLELNPVLNFILKTRSNFRFKEIKTQKVQKKILGKTSFSSREGFNYSCLHRTDYFEIDVKNPFFAQEFEKCIIQLINKFLQLYR